MPTISIPRTTPQRYISFKHALNLRLPDEDTGDWHFHLMFYDQGERSCSALLAGEGGLVNTNLALGKTGIRDMADVLEAQHIQPATEPVWVADHYRAIADLAMLQIAKGIIPTIATNDEINAWLDTEEQINHLLENYLKPLRSQLEGRVLQAYKQWMKTVNYE